MQFIVDFTDFILTGQKFALNEEKTILASVIRKYRIKSIDQHGKNKLMAELILRPQDGIRVTLEPRK